MFEMAGQLSHCGKCCAYTESDFHDCCKKCGGIKGERVQTALPDPAKVAFEFDGGLAWCPPGEDK